MEGVLHSIESLAAVDGEGLRCCVFLAGCPLRCAYCHNPDTWTMQGKRVSPEELVQKILRFRPFFGENGGVTFSGGEPLLQSSFLCEVARLLKKEGIRYMLDTSGHTELNQDVIDLLTNAQGVLLDLKFSDDAEYRAFTGCGIQRTLDFLAELDRLGTKTVVRTVVVPDVNDTVEAIQKYLDCISGFRCVSKYELLPFHTMGFFKYEKLEITNPFADKAPLPREKLDVLQAYVNERMKKNG